MRIDVTSEVIDYLSGAFRLDAAIQIKRERIAILKHRAARATGVVTDIRSSCSKGHIERDVCGYLELQEELEADTARYNMLRADIGNIIAEVEDDCLRALLECRYLSFMTWESIAESMHYSRRHITRLHTRALGEAGLILNKYRAKGA